MKTLKAITLLVLIVTFNSLAYGWGYQNAFNNNGYNYGTNSPAIVSSDGQYLGRLNNNPYDPQSVSNPYGQYGSPYSPTSINNPYGRYGSPYSPYSVRNPYAR